MPWEQVPNSLPHPIATKVFGILTFVLNFIPNLGMDSGVQSDAQQEAL